MTWQSGTQRPHDPVWEQTKRTIRAQSGKRCQVVEQGQRCGSPARDVDHIIPYAEGGGSDVSNARMICPSHHKVKTQREAMRAAQRQRDRGRRAPEPHPFDISS
jgi:5-methylcytosine-specific restriction endonuclease McrA